MYSTVDSPFSIAVGEFNNDAHLDIVIAAGSTVNILLGYSDGSFAYPQVYIAGSSLESLAVGDFNNDTYLDVVVPTYIQYPHGFSIAYRVNTVNILLGYGDGTFALQQRIQLALRQKLSLLATSTTMPDWISSLLMPIATL